MHYKIKVSHYNYWDDSEVPASQLAYLTDQLEKEGLAHKDFDSYDEAWSALMATDLKFIDDSYYITKIPFKFKRITPEDRQEFINSLRGFR